MASFNLDSSVYIWPTDFAAFNNRPFNPRVYNDPFVFRFRRAPARDGASSTMESNPATASKIIKSFVRHLERDIEPYTHQSSALEEFCAKANFTLLSSPHNAVANTPLALLDDRSRDTCTKTNRAGNQRVCNFKMLTATDLYNELLKKRYNMPGEHDVDRRLIYLVNLDEWATLALASTASERQTYFLRDFIYSHLFFETALRIRIPPRGIPSFGLEFHFPFFALRPHSLPYRDHRRRENGCPLRRSRTLQYLANRTGQFESNVLHGCVYEASVSCLVSGTNNYSWIAYLFVDTYYGGAEHQESVKSYHSMSSGRNQANAIRLDPLTLGKQDANKPIWTAREYFLRVFEARIEQVKLESRNLILSLLKSTEHFTPDYFQLHEGHTLKGLESHTKESQNILNDTVRLMQNINQSLILLLNSWDRFDRGDRGYFRGLEKVEDDSDRQDYHLLVQIKNHFQDIDQLRRQLEGQMQRFERLAIEIDVFLKFEDKHTAETVKVLTVVQSFSNR